MCGDGVRKGIPHVGGAFHFGFAQSQHIGLHFPKDPRHKLLILPHQRQTMVCAQVGP